MQDSPDADESELIPDLDLAELDLDVGYRAPPRTLYIEYTKDLSEADLAALRTGRGIKPKSLVRIHASHHSLARCLAAGMKPGQAGLVTGYSASRMSILQNDPAFQALVADYRAEAKSVFADLAERMSNLSLDAIEVLQDRLHDNPEGFSINVLLDLVRTFADRTGHGPNQEVSLKVSGDLIDRPPRETHAEWEARRTRELADPLAKPPDNLN